MASYKRHTTTDNIMIKLLKQARVIDAVSGTDQIADVKIENGRIVDIAASIEELSESTEIIDCQGFILGTGLIDLYSHSGEPGFEERETLSSLLQAAAAGGFTRICILPDTSPAIDNSAIVTQLQKLGSGDWGVGSRGEGNGEGENGEKLISTSIIPSLSSTSSSSTPYSPLPTPLIWGAITQDVAGQKLTELAELAVSGIVGFADGKPLQNLGMVRRVFEYLQFLSKPAAFWACDKQLQLDGVVREGADAVRFGLPFTPVAAETSAIAALLELVAATEIPIHIMRVSTARGIELIASAKSRGLPVTCSTTWMHLLLDTKALKSYHPSLRLEPPLGNPGDMKALREAVREGIVDAIAIDHTPYTYEEKTVAFADAPPGAIGYELALPLLWQHLVETGEFTALQLWQALSTNPAKCLQQQVGSISSGVKAELTLFNPQHSWKVESKNLYTLAANTPWYGQQLTGKVVKIWC
jgi:dihydroorotase